MRLKRALVLILFSAILFLIFIQSLLYEHSSQDKYEHKQIVITDETIDEIKVIRQKIIKHVVSLQFPKNCENIKILKLNFQDSQISSCGFGCSIHNILKSFVQAYFENLTVIVDGYIDYENSSLLWPHLFEPFVTTKCDLKNKKVHFESSGWNLNYKDRLPDIIRDSVIMNLAQDPYQWFYSIILSEFILKPTPNMSKILNSKMEELKFRHPIVGVQVRKTDKVTSHEAQDHDQSEYMTHVVNWFDNYQSKNNLKLKNKNIFLASDETKESKIFDLEFPAFNFIQDQFSSSLATNLKSRRTFSSLMGIITDVFLLSKCDHIVGTYSSNVLRLAAELKIGVNWHDFNHTVTSIDDVYKLL